MDEQAEQTSQIARTRNQNSVKVSRVSNGYIFTYLGSGQQMVCADISDVIELIQKFAEEKS